MPSSQTKPKHTEKLPDTIGLAEFIILIAAMTSIVAFSIDSMLPVLPDIGRDLGLAKENDRQFVILAFVFAFGPAQLLFGPISDALGRRPVMLGGAALFTGASIVAGLSSDLTVLLIARALQGIGASAIRVVSQAVVRDCFSGAEMARVMSIVFTVFIIVPIFAPALGQFISTYAEWHWLFFILAGSGFGLAMWYGLRMEETLYAANRRSLRLGPILAAFKEILQNRIALGYTLAVTLFFGGLFSFIVSIQQIIEVVYDKQEYFAYIFGLNALFMGLSSLGNATLVRRFGVRRISHMALILFTLFSLVFLITVMAFGTLPLAATIAFIAVIMGTFGFIAGNFNSLALEPLGHISGSAASVLGAISFTGGAVLGSVTGQMFDGTILPLAAALAFYGTCGVVLVLMTERGKLFGADS